MDLKQVTAAHGDEIREAVTSVVSSGRYLCGEQTTQFEADYARYVGSHHAVACSNGLDALQLILRAYIELGRLAVGDHVLVPANTFIASVLAITENGLVPVFVEPSPDTLEIDAQALEAAITPRSRALMLVHLYGRLAYSERIAQICRDRGLLLIEDNAQAHGCRFGSRRTGSLGDAAGHSFYPGKNLGALGDAGCVTTDDGELAAMVRTLANYGMAQKYVCDHLGVNKRMDELQAAVLGVKLKYLDEDNDRRRAIARVYYENLRGVALPARLPDAENVYHLFPVFHPDRDRLQRDLLSAGIETLIHYPIPPHRQRCYAEYGSLSLPVTERLAATELSLPISPVMSIDDALAVCEAVNRNA